MNSSTRLIGVLLAMLAGISAVSFFVLGRDCVQRELSSEPPPARSSEFLDAPEASSVPTQIVRRSAVRELQTQPVTEGQAVEPLQQEAENNGFDPLDPNGVPDELAVAPWENEFEWEIMYKDVPIQELETEVAGIEGYIGKVTREEFQSRFSSGAYEVLSTDGTITIKEWDNNRIMNLKMCAGGEVQKVELKENEYPHLDRLREKSVWLQGEARKRRGAAVRMSDR